MLRSMTTMPTIQESFKALLETAASLGYQRVICAFQPHTYTRTKALFSEFAAVLQQADVTFLAEILPPGRK